MGSGTISRHVARNPGKEEGYVKIMAGLAREIHEISDLYYFYVILGEDDPAEVEQFMGFSYDTAVKFFDCFLRLYLDTDDEKYLKDVMEKASLIGYSRIIRKYHKKGTVSEKEKEKIKGYLEKILDLTDRLDTLDF